MSTNTGSMQTQLFQLYQNLGGVVLPGQNSNSYSSQGWLTQINTLLEGGVVKNGQIINGTAFFVTDTKPTTRIDGGALVAGDKWYKPGDGTEWFWNGTYWLSDLKTVISQPTQSVTATTGGFPFVIESYSANILIAYYKVYFYLHPSTPLSDTDYHVLRLYRIGTALYDLEIKSGDDGAISSQITKTTPTLNIATTRNQLTASFRYDAGNGTPPTINIQPIPIRLFYHLIHD